MSEEAGGLKKKLEENAEQGAILQALPKEIDPLSSFLFWIGCACIGIQPVGVEKTDQAAAARKILGYFTRDGWKPEVKKHTNYDDSEEMRVILTHTAVTFSVRIDEYMPKTCRMVKKTITKPAVPEHTVAAKPAEKITTTVIECDGMPSQEISRETVKA